MNKIMKTEELLAMIDRFYDEHSEEEIKEIFGEIDNRKYDSVTLEEYLNSFNEQFKI